MLYIRDYQSLERFIPKKRTSSGITQFFSSMTGKHVTVFVDNRSQPFSGILLEVSNNRIRLVCHTICPLKSGRCRHRCEKLTSCIEYQILISHINAFVFYSG